MQKKKLSKKLVFGFIFILLGITLIGCNKKVEFKFDEKEITVKVEETKELSYTLTKGHEVEFSLNPKESDLISIEGDVITGLKVGEVELIGTVKNSKVKDSIKVIIVKKDEEVKPPVDVTDISIKGATKGFVGDEIKLDVTVLPNDATNKDVLIESSTKDLATVKGNVVTLLKEGKAVITIKAGKITKTHEITISKKEVEVPDVDVTDIIVKGATKGYVGEEIKLDITVLPNDATNKEVLIESSDIEVATVSSNVIKLLKEGKVTITIKAGKITKTHEITIEEKEVKKSVAFINDIGYSSIHDAISASKENDIIKIKEGIYTEELVINKNNITLTSYDDESVVIQAKITLKDGLNGFTINKLEFSEKAYIHAPAKLDNFVFTNNIVRGIKIDKTEYSANSRIDVIAFIRLYSLAGTNIIGNVRIENNIFENISSDVISIARTKEDSEIRIVNNEFINYPTSAIRFDGGYNNGTYNILDNIFEANNIVSNNAILFRAYAPSSNNVQVINIKGNEFINIGNIDEVGIDTYPGSAVIAASIFNDQEINMNIESNIFENTVRAIHLRNSTSKGHLWKTKVNHNKFIGTKEYIYQETSNLADLNYNMFIDENNVPIIDKDILKKLIINNDKYEFYFDEEIKLKLSDIDYEVGDITKIVDSDLKNKDDGEVIKVLEKDYIVGSTAFSNIKDALNKSVENDVIFVLKGTYSDDLTIDKSNIALIGPNTNVDPLKESRVEEAVITGKVLLKDVSNVIIDGFSFIEKSQILSEGKISNFYFRYNDVKTGLVFLANGKVEGFIKLISSLDDVYNESIIINNNKFDYTDASSPRYILASNIKDLYVVENEFISSYSSFTDAIRITGTNLDNSAGIGLKGNFYVYSNKFLNQGQSAIFVTLYNDVDVKIVNNDFENIKTTIARFRNTNDKKSTSSFEFDYNRLDINSLDSDGFINSALRVEKAAVGLTLKANYNHFKTIPFSYYLSVPEGSIADARYNFFEKEVDHIPSKDKMININDYSEFYDSLDKLPKYSENLIIDVEEIIIKNEITEMEQFETYKIEVEINPSNASNTKVTFESSDSEIARVNEYGEIFALREGEVTITVISDFNKDIKKEMKVTIIGVPLLDIKIDKTAIDINDELQIVVNKSGSSEDVIFTSLDEDVAVVSTKGLVTAKKEGYVVIKIELEGVTKEIELFVYNKETIDPLAKYLIDNSYGTVNNYDIKYIGSDDGSRDYLHNIGGSINNYLFTDKFEVTKNMLSSDAKNNPNKELDSLEWITVHDTGNTASGSTARANSNYVSNPSNTGSSWHYTVGNDGYYQQLEDNMVGWHAGDGTATKFKFFKTNVKAGRMFPLVTISSDGYFEIDGTKSDVSAPLVKGEIATNKAINTNGIRAVVGDDGYYHIPLTRELFTSKGAPLGTMAMFGGNNNSIGIEMAVNQGSDVWFTWQRTAKLVANLLVEHDLNLDRVVTHNHFSNKECPRTMMRAGLLDDFYKMIESEYDILKNFNDYKIELSSDSEIIDNTGRVVNVPELDQYISYTITITDKENNVTNLKLGTMIKGSLLN